MSLRIAAAAAVFALATAQAAFAAPAVVKFQMHPQNHSGEVANVTMAQSGPDVLVTVSTQYGPSDAQPIHIHKGTCDALDPKPAYPLTNVQNGNSFTTLKNMELRSLTTGGYAVNIHHSTADIRTYYACGNIPKV